MTKMPKTVVVGMSGGVDSSVAAALLLDQGYRVIGAFMKNWSEGNEEGCAEDCGWQQERQDALRVCAQLGIPFMTFDFEKEYRERVVGYMVREYAAGRTPNPDVMCNSVVKFDLFLAAALREGADMIATGHYARVESPAGDKGSTSFVLKAGVDNNKDQTYFLHQLTQEQLSRTLFPIGHLEKSAVRDVAREKGLLTAEKKDSQGICFIGKVDLSEFLKKRIVQKPGQIITVDGTKIGEHQGLAPFTIGQRHGINVGGGTPYFVVEKRADENMLVVAPASDESALYRSEASVANMHWISGMEPEEGTINCQARIRYRQPLQGVIMTKNIDNSWKATFTTPQRAVTPGQFLVLYDGEKCLGGGVIA